MTTIDKAAFSKAVKNYRRDHDLTQSELAKKLMTTVTTVARWEIGLAAPKNERMLRELKSMGIKW
ncbi:helix-turn-helix domain-containing protein [Candidatus Omnitrophota bacterium]